jgi:predicted signal transduction protein with EAL and GGDEF domain
LIRSRGSFFRLASDAQPVPKLSRARLTPISFICGIEGSKENLGIVRMVIALARSLSLQVIAVGVENEAQLEILREEGCHGFQGFLLARPLAPEALEALVQTGSGFATGNSACHQGAGKRQQPIIFGPTSS